MEKKENSKTITTVTSSWFECKVKYEKAMEDGLKKAVTELHVVSALSFTEAEEKITKAAAQWVSGEFEVVGIKKAPYREIFLGSDCDEQHYYKAKLVFIIIDEKTEKEKRTSVTYLVQAGSLRGAMDNVDAVMSGTNIEYVQANIGETNVVMVECDE